MIARIRSLVEISCELLSEDRLGWGRRRAIYIRYRWTLEVAWEQSDVIFYVIYISDRIAGWKGRIQKGSHTSKCLLQTVRNCFQIQLVRHT